MKLLWISNSPIGPAASILGEGYKGSSGGWVQSEYESLDKDTNKMFFLSTLPSVKKGDVLHRENDFGEIFCVNAPRLSYGISIPGILQKKVQEVIDMVSPDIIHIWGTETWLSNAVSKCNTKALKIIYIQGLIGVHKRYLGGYFGICKEDRKYLRGKSIVAKFKSLLRIRYFIKQADIEKETIRNCKNVILDSDFARAYCSSVSTDIVCHQHVLLPNRLFFKKRWELEKCNKRSIFTVYGSSAEKGTQNLIKAVSMVKKTFPDVKVIIPGGYQFDQGGRLTASKSDAFQNVLYNMICDLHIEDNVEFSGRLSASQMAETMVRCHVFVNPSCMENHALSLREAMIVGMPCISTHCGTVTEYLKHKANGLLYRYEEFEILAYYLVLLFKDNEECKRLAKNATEALVEMLESSETLESIYRKL